MTRFDALLDIDTKVLLGRTSASVIGDVRDESLDMKTELNCLLAYVMSRAIGLAPTVQRHQAVELINLASCLCATDEEVDDLLASTRDWLTEIGDLAATGRNIASVKEQARLIMAEHRLDALFTGGATDAEMTEARARYDALHMDDRVALDQAELIDCDTNMYYRASGGRLAFRFYDANTICVTTTVPVQGTAMLGMIDLGDEGGNREATPTPQLVA